MPKSLVLCLVFMLSTLTLKGLSIGFVEIPDGLVDEELRMDVDDMVKRLANEQGVALGVTVLQDSTRDESMNLALTPRRDERFVDLVIHLVLSTAGPTEDGYLVRLNFFYPQDEKALYQSFSDAFARCRQEDLNTRLRKILTEVSEQVEIFVLFRNSQRGRFSSSDESNFQPSLAELPDTKQTPTEMWFIITVVTGVSLALFIGVGFLSRVVAPKKLRFDHVTISRRLQAPYAGGASYLLKFRKKSRR